MTDSLAALPAINRDMSDYAVTLEVAYDHDGNNLWEPTFTVVLLSLL
jgi:hypothetical protein